MKFLLAPVPPWLPGPPFTALLLLLLLLEEEEEDLEPVLEVGDLADGMVEMERVMVGQLGFAIRLVNALRIVEECCWGILFYLSRQWILASL